MPTPSNRPGRVARLKAGLCGECGLHPRFRGQTRCEPCIKQMKAKYQEKREIKKHELDRLASQGGLPDGEEWRPISDFPGYRISRSGRVQSCRRSTKSGMALKHYQLGQWYDLTPRITKDGHLRVTIYRDSRPRSLYVHTLLAESFIGPKPDGKICRHLNDIPDDNRIDNLAWGTSQENVDDMFLNGTKTRAVVKALQVAPEGVPLEASQELLLGLEGTEEFRLLEAHPGYRVSNWGRVQSCRVVHHVKGGWRGQTETVLSETWRDLKPNFLKGKYYNVSLCHGESLRTPGSRRRVYVHALVLEAFVGPCPDGMQCRHKNDIGTDNRLENLAWGFPVENHADKMLNGGALIGTKNHAAKLRDQDVIRIRQLYEEGYCRAALAREHGVSTYTVWRIGTRKNWKHLVATS